MRSITLLVACCLAAAGIAAGTRIKPIADLRGASMKLDGGRLLVGLASGGVVAFDPKTNKPLFSIPGSSGFAVRDMVWADGVWWATKSSGLVHASGPKGEYLGAMDLTSAVQGEVRRLTRWQQYIMVHGEATFCFLDPKSQKILKAEQVLPPEVLRAARQGPVVTSWKDGKGLMVSIRRYSERKDIPRAGMEEEIGILTAWASAGKDDFKLLGGYTCSLVDFKDSQKGPRAENRIGEAFVSYPYGTADLGNIQLGPEGIVGLDFDDILTVPFYRNNWMPSRLKPRAAPRYARMASYNGSNLWWAEGSVLYNANLESGETDAYVSRDGGHRIVALQADEDGVFVLHPEGLYRINAEGMDTVSLGAFVRYELGSESERPNNSGRMRLAATLYSVKSGIRSRISRKSSLSSVESLFGMAGIPFKPKKGQSSKLAEVRYGDVLMDGENASVYVGNGRAVTFESGKPITKVLSLTPDTQIIRVIREDIGFGPGGTASVQDLINGSALCIGVAKPNPGLGHNLFVAVNPGSPYDGPYLPSHHQMLRIMESWVGTPYRWGGSTKDGVDCSGFVTQVFRELGVNLPRHSQWIAQAKLGQVVYDELRFGDVLVYPNPKHVAIYIGDGRTMETVGGGVGYSNIWRRSRAYVRRFLFQ